jgi:hypothetical protein
MVMCTECAFITPRQVLHKSDGFGERNLFCAGEHPGLGQCDRYDTT